MRRILLAAVAAAAVASPAFARDGSIYVGVDAGAMIANDSRYDFHGPTTELHDAVILDHKTGYDIDLNAGYDAGLVRIEGEIGY